jgi:hypothetical protein
MVSFEYGHTAIKRVDLLPHRLAHCCGMARRVHHEHIAQQGRLGVPRLPMGIPEENLELPPKFNGNFLLCRAYLWDEGASTPSMKRQVLSSGGAMVVAATGLLLGLATFAYAADQTSAHAMRYVRGRTIISEESPRGELTVRKGYRFVGTQQVNLYGLAEAEQYVFARQGRDNTVESFYWIQFEHFLPSNDRTYTYHSKHTTQIGDLPFVYNVGSWPDYAAEMAGNPASDGAAIERLLEKRHLSFPHRAAHVRMFHSPSADHRSELMIIYGEVLPQNSAIPVLKKGLDLDAESPDSAQVLLEHARQGLVIQTR